MIAFVAANIVHALGTDHEEGVYALGAVGAGLADMLRAAGQPAYALEEGAEDFGEKGSGPVTGAAVLEDAHVQRLLRESGVRGVLPFKPSVPLERTAAELGIPVLSAPAKLVRQLENKLSLPDIAGAADVPIPDTETVQLDAALVERARSGGLALPLVLQPAMSFAGTGTRILRSVEHVEDAVAHSRKMGRIGKLVELVPGDPVTVNGVVGRPEDAVLVGPVAHQLTSVPGLTPAELGSCGNEWSLPLAADAEQAVRALAGRLGAELARRGFRGTFGVDLVLREGTGEPVLIEVNPRWTGSLSLQVQLQRRAGLPTLLDAHLAAFDDTRQAWPAPLVDAYSLDTVPAALGPAASVIAYAMRHETRPSDAVAPGTWRLAPDPDPGSDSRSALVRVGDGIRIADLPPPASADDVVAVVLPQPPTRTLSLGSELVRCSLLAPASASSGELLPNVRKFVAAILGELQPNAKARAIHR